MPARPKPPWEYKEPHNKKLNIDTKAVKRPRAVRDYRAYFEQRLGNMEILARASGNNVLYTLLNKIKVTASDEFIDTIRNGYEGDFFDHLEAIQSPEDEVTDPIDPVDAITELVEALGFTMPTDSEYYTAQANYKGQKIIVPTTPRVLYDEPIHKMTPVDNINPYLNNIIPDAVKRIKTKQTAKVDGTVDVQAPNNDIGKPIKVQSIEQQLAQLSRQSQIQQRLLEIERQRNALLVEEVELLKELQGL